MLVRLIKLPGLVLAAAAPIELSSAQDAIDPEIKTAKSFREFKDTETGFDRIKRMFEIDEFDNVSPELHSIYNTGFLGLFCGICYGGFLESKKAYTNFMDRNQATAFTSNIEAKKKLQESVTLAFARGGWKLGWRMGIFAATYVGIATTISVYRNKYTIYEYIVGGAVTGALYKWQMGPRGMAAGFIVGIGLGTLAGGGTIGLLKLSGTTMEEVRYWQYKWKTDRAEAYKEGFEKSIEATDLGSKDAYQIMHDERLKNIKAGLEALPDESKAEKIEQKPEQKSASSTEEKVEK